MRVPAVFGLVVLAAALPFLLACPPEDKKKPVGAVSGACEKVGQSCEYSPGKLGTCVMKDDCKSESCFICQSQH